MLFPSLLRRGSLCGFWVHVISTPGTKALPHRGGLDEGRSGQGEGLPLLPCRLLASVSPAGRQCPHHAAHLGPLWY